MSERMPPSAPPSAPRDRLDVMRTVVIVVALAWVLLGSAYSLRAASAVNNLGGSSITGALAWLAALEHIALVAFVASLGIYVVLWLEERRHP